MGISELFSPQRRRPATIPSDTIVPVHRWDWTKEAVHTVPVFTFQFDGVLDPHKLREALNRLIDIGDWRKIGARLRRNDRGKLEYHIPAHFDQERPAFRFSTAVHETRLEDHPLAPSLPEIATTVSTASRVSWECLPLVTDEGMPRVLNDWLFSDTPLLSVHVVDFKDKSLLTVSYPHVLTDAQGFGVILRAWAAVLGGREDEVPVFHGFDTDPLSSLGDHGSPREFCYSNQSLSIFSSLLFGIRYLLGELWYPCEQRLTAVPQAYLDQMREQAVKEIEKEAANSTKMDGIAVPFISDSDIVLSWWTRMALRAHKTNPSRTVSIFGTMDIRTPLGEYFGYNPTDYIGNAALPLYAAASVDSVLQRGVGFLATEIRQAIVLQRHPDQVEATAAIISQTGNFPLVGDASMQTIFYTNWHRARFFEVDFSGALDVSADGQNKQPDGRPSAIIPTMLMANGSPMNTVGITIVGKDHAGNWIIQGTVRRHAMDGLLQQLKKLSL